MLIFQEGGSREQLANSALASVQETWLRGSSTQPTAWQEESFIPYVPPQRGNFHNHLLPNHSQPHSPPKTKQIFSPLHFHPSNLSSNVISMWTFPNSFSVSCFHNNMYFSFYPANHNTVVPIPFPQELLKSKAYNLLEFVPPISSTKQDGWKVRSTWYPPLLQAETSGSWLLTIWATCTKPLF